MYCCENAEAKVAERIKLYEKCMSEVLKEQLDDRITEEELSYIEILIYQRYHLNLEYDIK